MLLLTFCVSFMPNVYLSGRHIFLEIGFLTNLPGLKHKSNTIDLLVRLSLAS